MRENGSYIVSIGSQRITEKNASWNSVQDNQCRCVAAYSSQISIEYEEERKKKKKLLIC